MAQTTQIPPLMPPVNNLRPIGLMVVAMAFFNAADSFVKLASQVMPVAQVLVIAGFSGMLVFGMLSLSRGEALITRTLFRPAVMARNLAELAGSIAMFTALAKVDLSTVAAILQATPLAVTLGAAVLLGEPVGWRRWAATIVGFMGVLLIVRPGAAGFHADMLWPLAAMAALALRDLLTRMVPPAMPMGQLASYGMASLMLAGLGLLGVTDQTPVAIAPGTGLILAAMVATMALGYSAIIGAMRMGEVAAVAPFRYARILFALATGMLVFGERPDLATLIGAAITVAAGLYIFLREAALARKARHQAR